MHCKSKKTRVDRCNVPTVLIELRFIVCNNVTRCLRSWHHELNVTVGFKNLLKNVELGDHDSGLLATGLMRVGLCIPTGGSTPVIRVVLRTLCT